jgi:hypothetical protein
MIDSAFLKSKSMYTIFIILPLTIKSITDGTIQRQAVAQEKGDLQNNHSNTARLAQRESVGNES